MRLKSEQHTKNICIANSQNMKYEILITKRRENSQTKSADAYTQHRARTYQNHTIEMQSKQLIK